MAPSDPRSRGWVFTINNWTAEDQAAARALQECAHYLIFGEEVGDQEETPHLQGYVYFKDAKAFSKMKKMLPRAHLAVAKGNPSQNRVYCSKQGTFEEFGTCPAQGTRNDLDEIRDELKAGANMRAIVDKVKNVQQLKLAETWLKFNEKPRDFKTEIRWYWGPTGSGKSRAAREWLGEGCYTCMDEGKWFEGYDGHEAVLVDDFRKDFLKFHQMLKFLDRYEYRVETKGGSRQFVARKLAITAPYPPDQIYNTREDVGQLIRRIVEDENGVRHPDRIIFVGYE